MSTSFNLTSTFMKLIYHEVSKSPMSNLRLPTEHYMLICDRIIEQMKASSPLVDMEVPAKVVGDLAGNFVMLQSYLLQEDPEHPGQPSLLTHNWVFLGGYVNREVWSLETITLLFCLKLVHPETVVLLRGTHETRGMNEALGFKKELLEKFEHDDALMLFDKFNEAFSWMPMACLISRAILCMHGGISPLLNSLDDINNIHRPFLNPPEDSLAMDLLWAEPFDQEPNFQPNELRGCSVTFNETAVRECCEKLGVQLIVRSRQLVEYGASFFADQKMITIFSAPDCLGGKNRAALVQFTAEATMTVVMYGTEDPPN